MKVSHLTATILGRRNDWWTAGKSSVGSLYKLARDELSMIEDYLSGRRIQLIIGPRRAGKSILMQQTINLLLDNGVDPKRILFFSCDDPMLFGENATIGDIIECYANDVIHEPVSGFSDRVYVFIDEIHMFDGWQLWLKHYYEPHYNVKFIVSGSSASHLFDGSKESLLGRTDTLRLMPLGFHQFCRFWSIYRSDNEIAEFLGSVPEGCLYTDPEAYFISLTKDTWKWERFRPYVNAALDSYLLFGGYPEFFADSSPILWQKRLVDDIVGQGLYRDVVSIYRIKAPDKLEKLLYFIADNNGSDFNVKTIADTIGCDNETVGAYLTYLSQAYMTIVLSNYSPNTGKTIRKNKKLYVLDNGIANAVLRLRTLDETRTGHVVESICARNALTSCEENHWMLHYWREKGAEVDLVLDRKGDILPVEIKYRGDPVLIGLPAFRRAFGDRKPPVAVLITKNTLETRQDVLYIPFWLAH